MELLAQRTAEQQLERENLNRRKLRQIQVREQTNEWMERNRKKYLDEREKQIQLISNALLEEMEKEEIKKIEKMEKLYDLATAEVGAAHKAAANLPNYQALESQKLQENLKLAKTRGAQALSQEKKTVDKNVEAQRQAKILRENLRREEDERLKESASRAAIRITHSKAGLDKDKEIKKIRPEYQPSLAKILRVPKHSQFESKVHETRKQKRHSKHHDVTYYDTSKPQGRLKYPQPAGLVEKHPKTRSNAFDLAKQITKEQRQSESEKKTINARHAAEAEKRGKSALKVAKLQIELNKITNELEQNGFHTDSVLNESFLGLSESSAEEHNSVAEPKGAVGVSELNSKYEREDTSEPKYHDVMPGKPQPPSRQSPGRPLPQTMYGKRSQESPKKSPQKTKANIKSPLPKPKNLQSTSLPAGTVTASPTTTRKTPEKKTLKRLGTQPLPTSTPKDDSKTSPRLPFSKDTSINTPYPASTSVRPGSPVTKQNLPQTSLQQVTEENPSPSTLYSQVNEELQASTVESSAKGADGVLKPKLLYSKSNSRKSSSFVSEPDGMKKDQILESNKKQAIDDVDSGQKKKSPMPMRTTDGVAIADNRLSNESSLDQRLSGEESSVTRTLSSTGDENAQLHEITDFQSPPVSSHNFPMTSTPAETSKGTNTFSNRSASSNKSGPFSPETETKRKKALHYYITKLLQMRPESMAKLGLEESNTSVVEIPSSAVNSFASSVTNSRPPSLHSVEVSDAEAKLRQTFQNVSAVTYGDSTRGSSSSATNSTDYYTTLSSVAEEEEEGGDDSAGTYSNNTGTTINRSSGETIAKVILEISSNSRSDSTSS